MFLTEDTDDQRRPVYQRESLKAFGVFTPSEALYRNNVFLTVLPRELAADDGRVPAARAHHGHRVAAGGAGACEKHLGITF